MKPRIAIIADVKNWAWKRKADQLKAHLSDQFRLEVACLYGGDRPPKGCDLWNTFEVFMARQVPAGQPYVTGMTAHVWQTWEKQFGPGTVKQWASGALAFHANSRLLEAEMRALLDRPICYVPNGVDEKFFRRLRPRETRRRLVVGHVGKPNPRKGSSIVEQACERAGVELRTVKRTHRDALTPEQMRDFYQDLDVLAVASDMDGTPNPALEAAACGVAVVSNWIGNMPQLIVDGVNGRLVERDASDYAAVLRSLDVATAARMGDAARVSIEHEWTWAKRSRNYADMWNACLGIGRLSAVAR